jgi:hypothetical protein
MEVVCVRNSTHKKELETYSYLQNVFLVIQKTSNSYEIIDTDVVEKK